jgi:hypothetical protein
MYTDGLKEDETYNEGEEMVGMGKGESNANLQC